MPKAGNGMHDVTCVHVVDDLHADMRWSHQGASLCIPTRARRRTTVSMPFTARGGLASSDPFHRN